MIWVVRVLRKVRFTFPFSEIVRTLQNEEIKYKHTHVYVTAPRILQSVNKLIEMIVRIVSNSNFYHPE